MSKKQLKSIKTVGLALEELTSSLGIKEKLQEYDAVVHWEEIVGEQIARMTTATRITKGILYVQVKTSTWRNELSLRKKEIINKLNQETGINTVKDIKFQ